MLDDAEHVHFSDVEADVAAGQSTAALVTNLYRRHTNLEYLPEEPYFTTTVDDILLPEGLDARLITVSAPAPGTPSDSLYGYPTLPIPENGYHFAVPTEEEELPATVFRPFFSMPRRVKIRAGEELVLPVIVRNPLSETEGEDEGKIYNEIAAFKNFAVKGREVALRVSVAGLPEGCLFDAGKRELRWKPAAGDAGEHTIVLTADDGLIPETFRLMLCVE